MLGLKSSGATDDFFLYPPCYLFKLRAHRIYPYLECLPKVIVTYDCKKVWSSIERVTELRLNGKT